MKQQKQKNIEQIHNDHDPTNTIWDVMWMYESEHIYEDDRNLAQVGLNTNRKSHRRMGAITEKREREINRIS